MHIVSRAAGREQSKDPRFRYEYENAVVSFGMLGRTTREIWIEHWAAIARFWPTQPIRTFAHIARDGDLWWVHRRAKRLIHCRNHWKLLLREERNEGWC